MIADSIRTSDSVPAASAFWLDQLQEAHADLLKTIEDLARMTSGPPPSKELLVTVRWNVSKASLDRRLLWGRIHAHLSGHVDAAEEGDLRRLQETDTKLLSATVSHVGKWTTEAVIGDWQGYCAASETMRAKMLNAIGTEERLLYPLLGAAGEPLST